MTPRDAHGKGCWYFTTVFDCQLCGHADVYRERRWDEKPADPKERYAYHATACGSHFL